jgi:hypothetical protein
LPIDFKNNLWFLSAAKRGFYILFRSFPSGEVSPEFDSKKDGRLIGDDSFVKEGKTYCTIVGFPIALPASLTANATSRHFYITAYNEAVLSVIIQLDYDETRSFEELKNTLRQELPSLTGMSDTRGAKTADGLFSYEIGLALSRTYGIWMYVTDKANGTCGLEIEHIDLTNLSHYWMGGRK